MKVWKDKAGNKLTAKQFLKRFKEGVDTITLIQKLKNEARSTFTMLIGYIVGLLSLIIYREAFVVQWFTYALIIIFLGATWSNGLKWVVLRQQLKQLQNLDKESINVNDLLNQMEVKDGIRRST